VVVLVLNGDPEQPVDLELDGGSALVGGAHGDLGSALDFLMNARKRDLGILYFWV
jgi:hypothetical protein